MFEFRWKAVDMIVPMKIPDEAIFFKGVNPEYRVLQVRHILTIKHVDNEKGSMTVNHWSEWENIKVSK